MIPKPSSIMVFDTVDDRDATLLHPNVGQGAYVVDGGLLYLYDLAHGGWFVIAGSTSGGEFWAYDGSTLSPDPGTTTPLTQFTVDVVDGDHSATLGLQALGQLILNFTASDGVGSAGFGGHGWQLIADADGTDTKTFDATSSTIVLSSVKDDASSSAELDIGSGGSFSLTADDGTAVCVVQAGGGTIDIDTSSGNILIDANDDGGINLGLDGNTQEINLAATGDIHIHAGTDASGVLTLDAPGCEITWGEAATGPVGTIVAKVFIQIPGVANGYVPIYDAIT